MYKKRFKRWGLVKNNRRRDVEAMLEIQRQRKAMGKDTEFIRNGKPVELEDYLRRARGRTSTSPGSVALSLPGFVRCRTPPPQQPFALCFQEVVMKGIRHALSSYFSANDAHPNDALIRYQRTPIAQAVKDITNGTHLIENRMVEGHELLRRGFGAIHLMFEEHTIYAFAHLFLSLRTYEHDEIPAMVWRYLRSYSSTIYRQWHPMHALLEKLDELYHERSLESQRSSIVTATQELVVRQVRDIAANIRPALTDLMCMRMLPGHDPSDWEEAKKVFLRHQGAADLGIKVFEWPSLRRDTTLFPQWRVEESTRKLITAELDSRRRLDGLHSKVLDGCRYLQAQYNFMRWEEDPDISNPRLQIALHFLREHILELELLPVDGYHLHQISLLQSWQEQMGLFEEADATRAMFNRTLRRLVISGSSI